MKKKLVLMGLLMTVCFTLFGCGGSIVSKVENNMSEWTKIYYYGEHDDFYASLACGEREEEYLVNGKSGKRVDFALLSVKLAKERNESYINVSIKIDEEDEIKRALEFNGLNGFYMLDLNRELSGDEQITITFNDSSLALKNISKDFGVDNSEAIEIASKELEKEILKNKVGNNLNAECYLRVLDKQENNFDDVFWCFTVVNTSNENFSVVISTVDGSILAKTK